MEIALSPDIEQALIERARQNGVTPEQVVLESLRQQLILPIGDNSVEPSQGTLADFLGDSVGALHSSEYVPGGAHLSEATGQVFAAGLLKKRQQGHL